MGNTNWEGKGREEEGKGKGKEEFVSLLRRNYRIFEFWKSSTWGMIAQKIDAKRSNLIAGAKSRATPQMT